LKIPKGNHKPQFEEKQTIQWPKEKQTIQWPKEKQTIQWPREKQTIQWPKEKQTIQWPKEKQTIQWPKVKGKTTIYKTTHRKLKIEQHKHPLKTGVHSGLLEAQAGPVPHVALVVLPLFTNLMIRHK
jgi:hypothetical protein